MNRAANPPPTEPDGTAAPSIAVEGLTVRFGRQTVLREVHLAVPQGTTVAILGESGCGKTVLLKSMIGLIRPSAGDVRFEGRSLARQGERALAHLRTRYGFVFQGAALFDSLSIADNIAFPLREHTRLAADAIDTIVDELLAEVGLPASVREKKPVEISGGMRKRAGLARALALDPPLVLYDEPTTGLDPQARHVIWERLRQLLSQGKTILLTTHFMDEAERLCQRLAIMDHGKLITEGTPRELIARYIEPQVVEVYGDGAQDWVQAHGARLAQRCETSGETVFCYAADATGLVHALEALPEDAKVLYLHRHANLEDVFLKLTGRELRD